MKACTSATELENTQAAVDRACAEIGQNLGDDPSFILAAYTEHHDPAVAHRALRGRFPEAALLGSSTCRGLMTDAGRFGFGKPALALAALSDEDTDVGTAAVSLEGDIPSAVRAAVEAAQIDADRPGEVPDLVWLHASPGTEEAVIAALQTTLGSDVLISGGSSADETIGGQWSQFATGGLGSGAALALIYLDAPVTHHFQSGYLPTSCEGIATRATGRTLYEIDGQPAAKVYNTWSEGAIAAALEDRSRNILGDSAWRPIGKSIGKIGPSPQLMVDCYCLVHPDSVGPDGELRLFANVTEGSPIVMMKSGEQELIQRATQVVSTSTEMVPPDVHSALGLMVFCAGCMLALGDDIDAAAQAIRTAYGDLPFLGVFTFGEQGSFLNGDRLHGNLMISSSLLGQAGPIG